MPIGELARRRDIPVQFLEQLFATLRRAGVLKSQRGVKGGYTFARAAGEITVLEVVELLDGPLGRDAQGIFGDAAAAPAPCSGDDDRRRRRARGARGGRHDVPHLMTRACRYSAHGTDVTARSAPRSVPATCAARSASPHHLHDA